jgi:hypothetical protein
MTWDNVQDDCQLCDMEQLTEWYYEDDEVVVAEKPHGGVMIVLKRHTKEPTEAEHAYMKGLLNGLFGKGHETKVIMAHVEDHFHAHIVDYDRRPE